MAGIGHKNEARSTNYIMSVGDNRELTFAAQNANIADINLGTTPYGTGQKQLMLPSNTMTHSPLVLDVILSEDLSEWVDIYKWTLLCKNIVGSHLKSTKNVTLQVLTAQNEPSTEFLYTDAWPAEVSGIQYAINDDGSNVLSVTTVFYYNRFVVVTPNGERIDESYTG